MNPTRPKGQREASLVPARGRSDWKGEEKKRSGRRKMTAPEFGLKEVGSLFYIQLPLGPFF
jgi:hypothetical protein